MSWWAEPLVASEFIAASQIAPRMGDVARRVLSREIHRVSSIRNLKRLYGHMLPLEEQMVKRQHRPPKISPSREPSGRLSRASLNAMDAVSPTEARRLRDAAVRGIRGPEWGTEIGRMYLAGTVDSVAYETGKRWGRLVEAYHRAMGASALHPRAASLERREPGREPDPDSDEGKKRTSEDWDIIRDMQEAQVILASAGDSAEQAVRSVCGDDKCVVGVEGQKSLERGLTHLAEYWGLRGG